jgi:protein-S-isoprenylcysteine O-methyltransferase Ste14
MDLLRLSRVALPITAGAFALICLFGRAHLVRRRIGKNPVLLGHGGPVSVVLSRWSQLAMLLEALAIFAHAAARDEALGPIGMLRREAVLAAGLALLAPALAWVAIAQAQMGDSWRVGLDSERTELVGRGLYRLSRNPIYLGISVIELAVFLVTPNAASLAVVLLGAALRSVQVRLEEEHLERLHGDAYRAYCGRVRRWL